MIETNAQRSKKYAQVRRVLLVVLVANLSITAMKITLGFITGALAVVADGFHSLVDSSSNLIGLAAIRLAGRPPDESHPYGYQRYETLGALAIGGLLLVAAWEIGSEIVQRITQGGQPDITISALVIMVSTFPMNAFIAYLENRAGIRLNSEILIADAVHTRTDLYITASVVVSMFVVWRGWVWLDFIVATIVIFQIV
ncbi:MAG: cation diffusion facilitator family transporter, partial [Anaerolineales bacterium]